MNPQRFAESNIVMRAPAGMPECSDIHAWRDGERVLTYWRPDASELVRINLGEPIVLHVCGTTMPPVALTVGSAFEQSNEIDAGK